MKKIITLLIAAGAFMAVNAQTSKEEARKVILGGSKKSGGGNTNDKGRDVILGGGNNENENSRTYPNSYPDNNSSKQAQIDQVNREYDSKIYSIRNNSTLTQEEKDRMIRQLEKDRAKKIKAINNSNNGKKGKKYDDEDDDDRYEKKAKSNNGKHKGWTKGKGNQKKNKHSDRDDD